MANGADRFGRDTYAIIGACIEVHRQLGPGLHESVYEECLAHEMDRRGMTYRRQPVLSLRYKAIEIERAFQPDFIVDERIIVELETVRALRTVHHAQVRTYLKLFGAEVGLLVNFEVAVLRDDGIRRITLRRS